MSLVALNWKQLPNQIASSGSTSPQGILDAIAAAFASTTYIDGSARTPGSGIAWTRTTATEAVYLSPATNTLGQRVCIGGSPSVARALTLLSGTAQSSVIGLLYAGIGKNVTTNAANWYSNPFADGSFSGYSVIGAARVSTLTSLVRCYESSDAILITVEIGGAVYMACLLGAWLDPESANASDAESDGKLYGLSTLGTTASTVSLSAPSGMVNWAFNNSNAAYALLVTTNGGNNTYAQTACFTPGAATMLQLTAMSGFGYPYAYGSMTTLDNISVRFPILMINGHNSNFASQTFIARVRELWYTGYALNGTAYENNGSTVGYLISASAAQSGQAYLLTT